MNYANIIKKPHITEKVTKQVEVDNKYTFIVSNKATKGQVKEAIEKMYEVKVIGVHMVKNAGRQKRSMTRRSKEYRTKDIKKAIVQLSPDNSIKLFEGSN